MAFHVRPGDITEFKGDAIVNSLGTNTKIYGEICRNVIKGINDDNIKNYIDSLGELKPLTIIETKPGGLPCKRVIHVVTPFKKNDPDNTMLLKCYRRAIKCAINLGLKSIAIPLIGTGNNGYSKYDSYEALKTVGTEICDEEEKQGIKIIDIFEYLFIGKKNYYEERNERRERGYENTEYSVLYDCCKTFSHVNLNDSFNADINEFYNNKKYKNDKPYYFFLFMLEKKGIELNVLNPICRKEERNSLSKVMHLANKDIMLLSALVKFTRSEVLEFMAFNGSCFSPKSTLDMAFMKCLKRWNEIEDYADLIDLVYEETLITISFNKLIKQFKEMDKAWTTDKRRKELLDYADEHCLY